MNRPRRIIAVAVASLAMAACGGGDDDAEPVATPAGTEAPVDEAPASTESADTPADTSDLSSGDEVDPTIAPDLPEAFLAGVGPLAVIGDPLPDLPIDPGSEDPAVGMPAPVLVGENFDGERVRVEPAADGATWIVFLAHWCPHCNDEIPVINELGESGSIPEGIDVVGVSTAVSPERPNYPPGEWLDDKDWAFAELADGIDTVQGEFIAAGAYGVSGFPFSVLVDGDGIVQTRWSGERDPAEIKTLLDNLALG